eukprot:4020540-Prymnesium_polylepis.1
MHRTASHHLRAHGRVRGVPAGVGDHVQPGQGPLDGGAACGDAGEDSGQGQVRVAERLDERQPADGDRRV